MAAAVLGEGLFRCVELFFQQFEAQASLFRIRAVVVVVIAGGIVVIVRAVRLLRRGVFGGFFTHERLGVVRVKEAGYDVADAAFVLDDALVGLDDGAGGAREVRNGRHYVADAFFDALGDDDFAFAGQQFNGTHFAHVHAHRVGGAAGIGFYGGQGSGGLCGSGFVGSGIAFGHQQGISVRRFFAHLDTHVVDHPDDIFNLIRICDVFRQVVVYLGVSQVTLFLASCDEVFQT